MQRPANIGDVRRFLGMANQLSKFAPGLAEKSQPLRELLIKNREWMWGEPQEKAFEAIKGIITQSPVLAMFDPDLQTIVAADASSFGLGAVLHQKQPSGELKPACCLHLEIFITLLSKDMLR